MSDALEDLKVKPGDTEDCVLVPVSDVERAKKIEAAANAALGYVVGDVAYQRLAAALTRDNQEEAR